MRISTVVVHVGRRLGSPVQLSTVQSCDLPMIIIIGATMLPHKARCSEGNTRFSDSRRRAGPRDNHQEAAEGTRAHFCAGHIFFFALVLTQKRLEPPPCPKVATKRAKPGCSDRIELAVDMVDRAEATPGLSSALLAAPWRAW